MGTRVAEGDHCATAVGDKAIASRLYDAFNEAFRTANLEVLDEVIATDIVDHNPAPGQEPGREGVKQFVSAFRAAFPDARNTVEAMIAEGNTVAARVILSGTHRGQFMGIPPTGERVAMTGIEIIRYAGGKAVERWGEFDRLGLMQQLGVISAPERAAR